MLTGSLKIAHVKTSSKTIERTEVIWRNGDMVDVKKDKKEILQYIATSVRPRRYSLAPPPPPPPPLHLFPVLSQ